MILHTGMRTDIPAFYAPWFLNRLREGYVLVRNPYDPASVTRYTLDPKVVDLLCFCTKNPGPMLEHMAELQSYGQYWFVTITPYGRDIEPRVPPKEQVMADFRRLSQIVGPRAVCWRYDPILLHGEYTLRRHLQDFESMAQALAGATDTCVISFVDLYDKVRRNFPQVQAVDRDEQLLLGQEMARIGQKYGIRVKACGEGDELESVGVDCSGCMTIATFERALGRRLHVPKFRPARAECACYLGHDIGAYDTCAHLCRYCYANTDEAAVRRNLARHDPDSPFLIGGAMPGDRVHQARQESWLEGQISLLELLEDGFAT